MTAARASAVLERVQTFGDLHFYQKWHAVWPVLSRLQARGIRLLDAGCGDGRWSAEIGRRRPAWDVCGVDRDAEGIEKAEHRRCVLRLPNLSYWRAPFDQFSPERSFDVILSVCSTHYERTVDDTAHLFRLMNSWLIDDGLMILLVPRCVREAPFVSALTRPQWHDVFSRDALAHLCNDNGFVLDHIAPCIGRLGTVAKQLDWASDRAFPPGAAAISLMARSLALLGTQVAPHPSSSLMWLVVAHRSAAR
jgi:SAM-dependent methyltransferase